MEKKLQELYRKICAGTDVRASLIELKKQCRDVENRRLFCGICAGNYDVLMKCLVEDDPKIRKNAAALLGELGVQEAVDVLMDAYEAEETLFVRPEYVRALTGLDCAEYFSQFHKRLDELTAYPAPENEKKHVAEEIRALRELLLEKEGLQKHVFTGFHRANEVVLTANPAFRDVLAASISAKKRILKGGVRVTVGDMNDILQNRLWQEMLFVLHKTQKCDLGIPAGADGEKTENDANTKADAEAVRELAAVLRHSDLMEILEENHSGDAPFYFRVGVRGLPREESGALAREVARLAEAVFPGRLVNSVSHYEAELRILVKKDGALTPFLKLYTLPDRRFAYRKYYVAAGMKPSLAAGLMALAKPYLKEYAQVLDPFCGVGTLLVERTRALPTRNLYGIDTFGEAIAKARANTKLARLQANYVNRDFFDFTHAYPFDEIVTDMPSGMEREQTDRLYRMFFEKAHGLLGGSGRIVLYSGEMGLVKKYLRLQNRFRLLDEWCISEKSGMYLFVLEKK